MIVRLLRTALITLLGTSAALAAQTKPAADSASSVGRYRFRLLGVYDALSGDPIDGVEVADVLNRNSALTTKTGTVSLFFLPDGGALVRLRKIGYETQTLPIAISPADTTPITIVLQRATTLPTVVVKDSAPRHLSPALRGFEERRARGNGHFITDSVFRRHENTTMANLLVSHLSGIFTVPGVGGAKYLVSARKQCAGRALQGCRQPNCYVRVYVDGIQATGTQDVERMSPVDYAAAELYQGAEIPPGYSQTNTDCGVLLLWTRER